ncbi:MAG: helix-turn-helix domain-containing protein [Butyricicoccus sp.]
MTGERLTWLLRALGVSGKQLADEIGVDYSTMSKWRRDKRMLKYSSPYAHAIAQWALCCPAEQESGVLHRMLHETYPGLDDSRKLEHALCLWLTLPDTPADAPAEEELRGVFEVPLETSLGLENLFDAQKRIFGMLRDLPPGQQVTVTDCGAVDWAHVGRGLIEEGVRENTAALTKHHTMRIIDQLTDTYHPGELMFQWLPMYLQPTVSTWFYRNPKPMPLRQNLILIHGHAALTMLSTPAAPGLVISSLYRDPEYVRLFDAVVDTILHDSYPMMQRIETAQLTPFLDILDAHMKSSRLLYMINRLPTFRNMPAGLLDEILRDNQVTGALYDHCMAAGRQSTATRGRCESRQVYDLDAIEAALERGSVIDYDLSAVVGREIRISRKQFQEQLAYLYDHVRTSHYTLVVYPFSRLDMTALPPCNMIVQDDSLAAAWDAEKYPHRMYTEDLAIVNGFYQYADALWEHISPVCKDEAWCKRRIGALLA